MHDAPPARLRWVDLTWKDPALKARHAALLRWIEANTDGWAGLPPRRVGNFITERWTTRGVSPAARDGGAVIGSTAPGDGWRQLETLFYPSEPDTTFGLGVAIGQNPKGAGAGVHFSSWTGGATIVGDHVSIRLLAFDGQGKSDAVDLGDRVGLRCVDTPVEVTAPGGGLAELARLAASPASLLATAKERFAALRAEAEAALADGRVKGFDEGRYEGRGIPPERTPRPLTDAEEAAELAKVRAEVARRVAVVEAHAEAFHRALVATLPLELLTR